MKTNLIRLFSLLLMIGVSTGSAAAYNGVLNTGPVPEYDPLGRDLRLSRDAFRADTELTGDILQPRFLQWERQFNHTQNGDDELTALAVAPDGSIWVTGIVQNLWTGFDFKTIIYEPDGAVYNEMSYQGPAFGNDYSRDIAIDQRSAGYVLGQAWSNSSKENIVLIKYDEFGDERWIRTYDGPGGGYDEPTAMALDSTLFNVIGIVGTCETGYSSGRDYCIIIRDGAGNLLTEKTYSGDGSLADYAMSIAFDSMGDYIVTGHAFHGIETEYDITTLKYDALGDSLLWEVRYSGYASEGDYAVKVLTDSRDNVIVAGRTRTGTSNKDYLVLKYDPDGNFLWEALYNGPLNREDFAADMAIDSFDNIYVTGRSRGSDGYFGIATVKYSSDGTELWARRYEGFPGTFDEGYAIVVDGGMNVYVTGTTFDPVESGTDIITLKYDENGALLWTRTFDGSGQGADWPSGIISEAGDGLYIGGTTYGGPETSSDYLLIKYNN